MIIQHIGVALISITAIVATLSYAVANYKYKKLEKRFNSRVRHAEALRKVVKSLTDSNHKFAVKNMQMQTEMKVQRDTTEMYKNLYETEQIANQIKDSHYGV